MGSSVPLEWKFSQVFGEQLPGEEVQDVDVISTIEFDQEGKYLAVGDQGGRIVLFETIDSVKNFYNRKELENSEFAASMRPLYRYRTEFQSHEPELDYLNSLEIEEKINKIRWFATLNNSLFLLSANGRTIKLWKLMEKKVQNVHKLDMNPLVCFENTLLSENSYQSNQSETPIQHRLEWKSKVDQSTLSSLKENESANPISAKCRRVYSRAHEFNINSISTNSDGETYISADDLRINLWNLEISDQCFNILDMKPPNMEDLTEVITTAEFHPNCCNLLAYGSSRGFIRLVDMRRSALCDWHAKMFQDREAHGSRSLFSEIIASISDLKFTKDGRYILSRDYMSLKLWDLHMEGSPVATYKIHEYIRPKLCDLYNNDSIFDKFECCLSMDGLHFASGTYSNRLRLFSSGAEIKDGYLLEVRRDLNCKKQRSSRVVKQSRSYRIARRRSEHGLDKININMSKAAFDSNLKLLHLAWHPRTTLIACAAANGLYLFNA